MKKIVIMASVIVTLFITPWTFADNNSLFSVTATGDAANININLCLNGKGSLSCQNYTVTALNLSIITTVPNHTYPAVGIKINTPGYSLENLGVDCTPNSDGYCVFSVSDTQPASIAITPSTSSGYTIGGTVSNLTASGLILQNNSGDSLIVNSGATSFQFATTVAAGGSYNVTVQQQPTGLSCIVTNGSGTNVNANITNVSITCGGLAYIANQQGTPRSITRCLVNRTTGLMSNCINSSAITLGIPMGLAFNSSNIYAYTAGRQCSVNANTTNLSNCVASGSQYNARWITLNSANTYAYMSNTTSPNNVAQCTVQSSTGALANCFLNSATFSNGAQGVALNPANTYLYVITTTIAYKCDVNSSDGTFSNCTNLNATGLTGAQGIAINSTNTFAYIVNSTNSTVRKCTINSSTGAFSGCVTANATGLSTPAGIVLNSTNTLAYITNTGSNSVVKCAVDSSTGLFSNCVDTGATVLQSPAGIVLVNF